MKHLKFFVFLCILTFTVSCGQQKRYIQYKVKKGETMSAIAQKLKMNTPDLLRLNPDVVGDPKANTFIVVPENKLQAYKRNTPEVEIEKDSIKETTVITEKDSLLLKLKEKYQVYEVKKGDTFFNIKQRFGKSREELLVLNPELKEGLKLGMLLKIKEIEIENVIEDAFYSDIIEADNNLKVALLLPFRASNYQAETLSLKEIFAQDATLLNIVTDFYLGAELAVDSLRSKGVNINLNVFDTGLRNSGMLPTLVRQENLNSYDAIIGPLYSSEVETVASMVRTPVVFPVYSNNQLNFTHNNIIKTSPEKIFFREELENYIKTNFEEGNIIIVCDDTAASIQTASLMQANLQIGTSANVTIIKPNEGYIAKERFLELLTANTNNWVVIATSNQVIASDAINSLISLPEETTARAFTFDKGNVYNKIDNAKLAQVGFTYVSDEFADETSFEVNAFNSMYLRKNKTLPSYYAIKGFDITYDILIRLASGNDLKRTFSEGISKRVETKFDYTPGARISENRGVYIVKYNEDLSLTKLK